MMKFIKNTFLLIFVLVNIMACRAASAPVVSSNSKTNNTVNSPVTNDQSAIANNAANEESASTNEETNSNPALDKKLLYAAKDGNDAQVQDFLKQGANADILLTVSGVGKVTPLTWALANSHESTAEILLKAGVNVNRAADFTGDGLNEKNVTPLKIAAKNGLLEVVKKLVEKGADVNAATGSGDTPLMTGEVGIVKYLLEHGANPNAVNKAGDTPLIILVGYLQSYPESEISEGVKALVEKGADITKANKRGETAMSLADTNGAETVVNELKSAPAKGKAKSTAN